MPDVPPTRRWPLLASRCMLLCLLPLANLRACGPQDNTPPTRGPITTRQWIEPTMMNFVLSSSTNCADVGQVITFTVRLENNYREPVTFDGNPPVDMVISPVQDNPDAPIGLVRWSESPTYPAQMITQIGPGESHSYQWQWRADEAYENDHWSSDGIAVHIETNAQFANRPLMVEELLYVGIQRLYATRRGPWLCTELPTAVPTPTVYVLDRSQ
ncbi:hypothetical protein F8S13_05400 [Chloroflexia bacterium SDU3-3]|nr:hypothetical protein F8S13_05400 [Chloroflexia bacterium SDU3-3]